MGRTSKERGKETEEESDLVGCSRDTEDGLLLGRDQELRDTTCGKRVKGQGRREREGGRPRTNLFPSRGASLEDGIFGRRKFSDMVEPGMPLWRDLRDLVLILGGREKNERERREA